MRTFETLEELIATQGEPIGYSDWLTVDQAMVNLFADATGDHQWIHVDPDRAKQGPFGGPIAHGYLTLSLLPVMSHTLYSVDGVRMGVNYGLNKVRFPSPVPVGSRVRSTSTVLEAQDVGGGAVQVTLSTTVEIEGAAKPACVAENVVRYYR